MYYTAQQICAQVAHLIMQLKYKANTHTHKEQTKWFASQKATHNVICIYIHAGRHFSLRALLENTEGNNAANAAWQQLPLSTLLLLIFFCLFFFAAFLSLGCASAHLCGICIISSMSYVSALCCASPAVDVVVGIPWESEIFVITAATHYRVA